MSDRTAIILDVRHWRAAQQRRETCGGRLWKARVTRHGGQVASLWTKSLALPSIRQEVPHERRDAQVR